MRSLAARVAAGVTPAASRAMARPAAIRRRSRRVMAPSDSIWRSGEPFGPHVRRQSFLAEAQGLRRHLDELVVVEKFDGLFEAELARRDEANRFVSRGRAHVGLLLLARDVDVQVVRAGVFTDD